MKPSSKFILLLNSLLIFPAAGLCDEPFRHVISSTSPSRNDVEWRTSSENVTPHCDHHWWIQKSTLHGGRQEGVEQSVINNGRMEIVLCPTRGMGIMSVRMGNVHLKWDSPVKEVVHPQYINLASRGGLGWLEGFNEFMCRCGLENNGHPGTDKFVNNVGEESEMELTLHGKISNIPASHVEVAVDRTAPYAIHIKGLVNERFLFGPKLELHTELIVVPGENTFQLKDEIRNTGSQEQEFQIIYHANFGSPILQEGARVVAPATDVQPFNDHAAKDLDRWHTFDAPQAGFVEQVYLLTPKGDQNNHTTALIHDKAFNTAASISWSLNQLPYLTVWKNTGASEDGYVTGIEPGTNFPNNRSVERAAGRVPKLAAGESRHITLTFGLYDGLAEVKNALTAVNSLTLSGEAIDSPPIEVPKIDRLKPRQ